MKKERLCLLIGNSRWHWAKKKSTEWKFFHTNPNTKDLVLIKNNFLKWAAVGKIPNCQDLNPSNRITIDNVPLGKLPPWIGIDRALAGWGAWLRAKSTDMYKNGLLIADAGTVLSLTHINAQGEFSGGQLIAGLRLQISAMAAGTANLKNQQITSFPETFFPHSTREAMLKGSQQALLAPLIAAQKKTQTPIWLCGGDAPILLETLKQNNSPVYHYPNLVMEGMINIQNESNQIQDLTEFD